MKKAWFISFIRIPLLLSMMLLFFLVLKLFGLENASPFFPDLAVIYFTIVNAISFFLLHHILKKEGRSIKDLVGFQRDHLGKDILLGFLWLFVLFIPFVLAVMGTMFIMYGTDFINQFEAVFAGDVTNYSVSRPLWLLWFAAIVSLIFPFLNAPIEELMYRGYAQSTFNKESQKMWPGILIPSIGFSLQHIMLAASVQGAIVYSVAFFWWGIGSALIFHKQQRLFPLIICHFMVNISFSIFPIVFLSLGIY